MKNRIAGRLIDTALAALLLVMFVFGTAGWAKEPEPAGMEMKTVESEPAGMETETVESEPEGSEPAGETQEAQAKTAGAQTEKEEAQTEKEGPRTESAAEEKTQTESDAEKTEKPETEEAKEEAQEKDDEEQGTPEKGNAAEPADVEEEYFPEGLWADEETQDKHGAKEGETADFTISVETDSTDADGGSLLLYEVRLTNTGTLPLEELVLESTFSCPKVMRTWEAEPELSLQEEDPEGGGAGRAVLASLQPGETRNLYLTAQLAEEQSGKLLHTVTARAVSPEDGQETIVREASVRVTAVPLEADFTVEKSADRTQAMPGEAVTYWICIRNTGERTLHSVVSTERFLGADVTAQFAEQEGITLSENASRARIPRILPGEAVNLSASVVIPQEAAGQELINEVTVVAAETGERTVRAQAALAVGAAKEEYEGEAFAEEAAPEDPGKANPRTADAADAAPLLLAQSAAALAAAGVFRLRKGKRKR